MQFEVVVDSRKLTGKALYFAQRFNVNRHVGLLYFCGGGDGFTITVGKPTVPHNLCFLVLSVRNDERHYFHKRVAPNVIRGCRRQQETDRASVVFCTAVQCE